MFVYDFGKQDKQLKKKKQTPQKVHASTQQYTAPKIHAYIFYHSFNQSQIPTLVPVFLLCFIKQVEANQPHASNDCGQYPSSTFQK